MSCKFHFKLCIAFELIENTNILYFYPMTILDSKQNIKSTYFTQWPVISYNRHLITLFYKTKKKKTKTKHDSE